jgi:hypothetical protein
MITIALLEKIEALLPGRDAASALRRRVVRVLADAGGQLSLDEVRAALGSEGRAAVTSDALKWWHGLDWQMRNVGGNLMQTCLSLAPWLRQELELPPTDANGTDPLAGVRAAVARARNVATTEEALAHAFTGRVRLPLAS